jgi:hypothetical protein
MMMIIKTNFLEFYKIYITIITFPKDNWRLSDTMMQSRTKVRVDFTFFKLNMQLLSL